MARYCSRCPERALLARIEESYDGASCPSQTPSLLATPTRTCEVVLLCIRSPRTDTVIAIRSAKENAKCLDVEYP